MPCRWRQNVDKWLPESAILENIRNDHKPLVRAAYRFLSQAGYINFGVAPAIKERVRTDGPKATMIIIGAGLAGLAAARQLLAFGHKVIIEVTLLEESVADISVCSLNCLLSFLVVRKVEGLSLSVQTIGSQ